MTIYFTADLHLSHANVIKYDNRPFKDIEEMDTTITNNWNEIVNDDDTVYVLGDVLWKASYENIIEKIGKLKGHKHLILGNHDKKTPHIKSDVWETVKDYLEIKIDNIFVIMSHYPIIDWDGMLRGSVHLYGHVHNSMDLNDILKVRFPDIDKFRSMNVGIMKTNYYPISWEKIKDILEIQ